MLDAIVLEPPQDAKACVIWLHGLGATGDDFVPAVPECGLPEAHAVRFVFPHAPSMPVTLNGGMVMPAWYDIKSLSFKEEDRSGLENSRQALEELIAQQVESGIDAQNIMLIGFSQGGALALYAALSSSLPIAAVASLSGYLPLHESLLETGKQNGRLNIPVFMGHGQFDMVVPFQLGQASAELLKKAGFKANFTPYAIEHTVNAQELADLGDFIKETLIP